MFMDMELEIFKSHIVILTYVGPTATLLTIKLISIQILLNCSKNTGNFFISITIYNFLNIYCHFYHVRIMNVKCLLKSLRRQIIYSKRKHKKMSKQVIKLPVLIL